MPQTPPSLLRFPNWQPADSEFGVFDDDHRSIEKLPGTRRKHPDKPWSHGGRRLVVKTESDDTWQRLPARGKQISEIEIKRQDDALLRRGLR